MAFSDFFHLVTLEDGKRDSDAIIKIFQNIHDGLLPCDVKLLNYYREIPVSFNATITGVMDDRIDMDVHQNQAVVLKQEKQTLIKCEYFPNGLGVHSFVAMTNVNSGRTILTRFAYAQITAEKRGAVRVEVDFPLTATFLAEGIELVGNVSDMSVNAISVALPIKPALEANLKGRFICVLPEGKIDVPAQVLKIIETETGSRAIITFSPDSKLELLISQFILSLQVGIIRDLKAQYF